MRPGLLTPRTWASSSRTMAVCHFSARSPSEDGSLWKSFSTGIPRRGRSNTESTLRASGSPCLRQDLGQAPRAEQFRPSRRWQVRPSTDRTLVEGCCELGSLLQRKTKFSRGCRVVPITKDDDFASDSGMRKCIEHLKSAADTLWFSAPCTGGSAWQYINLKRGPSTVAKIKLHWRLFKWLWAAFEIVASHALSVGARVFIEWPRHCAYWRQPKVEKFLQQHGFVHADFDGCMYGLVATKGPSAGTPI